jgi:MFS transporter, ACS family, glucarate transporter
MKARHRVLGFLSLLSVITYLDRVCISIAGPRMQEALSLSPEQWGWVTGAFTLAYAMFEMPSGSFGDRIGPRRSLTRIVLWWSAFTSFTGAVSGFIPLIFVRFLFGMGEAGAYPNIGVSLARWFPLRDRTKAWGIVMMAAQIGGALAPFLVVPIQQAFGWRASFWAFGSLGVLWAAAWYFWFRDSPQEMAGVSAEEAAESGTVTAPHHSRRDPMPWSVAVRSGNLWALAGMAGGVGYSMAFFQSWLGTYLVKARGFTEAGLLLASVPFIVGALANLSGGFTGDAMVRKLGLQRGRRMMFLAGYGGATVFLVIGMLLQERYAALAALSMAYGGITFGQPALMSVCLDMGGKFSGAITGAMNTAAYVGAFLGSVMYGYLVAGYGYTVPFIPMIVLMALGAALGLRVNATEQVVPE